MKEQTRQEIEVFYDGHRFCVHKEAGEHYCPRCDDYVGVE